MFQVVEQQRVMHILLEKQAEKYSERIYLIYEGREYSFKEVNDAANRVASGLQKLGIKKGDKVAVVMDNSPEIIFLMFGLSKLGAIKVPINTALKGELMLYMLNQSDTKMVVLHNQYIQQVAPLLEDLPKLESILVVDGLNDSEEHGKSEVGVTIESELKILTKQIYVWDKVINNIGDYVHEAILWSDPILILYTSGTTGPSKGVLIPHNLLYTTIERVGDEVLDMTEDDCVYLPLPLFHIHAWHSGINQALYKGARVVLRDKFSASNFWDEIKQYGCTYTAIVGSITSILYKAEPKQDDADNPLRVMLGSPTPAEIFESFQERFGVRIVEFYGSTEIGSPITNTLRDYKVGTAGKVHPNYLVKIVDNAGVEVKANIPGEICVQPLKPYSSMLEYYKMPDKTAEVWQNGWYHSGDIGCFDEEGYLIFVDRKKDAIRRRGENISSFEVEKMINNHPAVLESAIIGVKSELGEDDVMVCIVRAPGQSITYEELMIFCEEQMAYFMVPRYVRFVDCLPKTPSHRVEKYKLRDQGITVDTWDREKAGYKVNRR